MSARPALDKIVALLLHDPVKVRIAEAQLPTHAPGSAAAMGADGEQLAPGESGTTAPLIEHTVIRCPAQDKASDWGIVPLCSCFAPVVLRCGTLRAQRKGLAEASRPVRQRSAFVSPHPR